MLASYPRHTLTEVLDIVDSALSVESRTGEVPPLRSFIDSGPRSDHRHQASHQDQCHDSPTVVSSPRRPVSQRSAVVVGGTSRGGPGGSASQRRAAASRSRHPRVQLTFPTTWILRVGAAG